jgi:hypothetical protein
VGECLHQRQSDLSPECQAKLEKVAQHSKRFAAWRALTTLAPAPHVRRRWSETDYWLERVRPSVENVLAIRAFEKAGFR